ncbi:MULTISPECIES: ABC transporter permease [Providencia]|uniref:ABC transporter permease n=1 Tax=Providencia huaxiensis TaxID=2027290 RepID=A0A345M0A4_9GAMM|nr:MULTISPECIES: ABC transporter permease [Providencia]AXH63794.1 ABC transporter permease [Providencia huaxiensis]MBN6361166.1 ABC transporter permease [Providencia huaxiensis]MBQ0268215.1 ABC transporter permease [Providencia huaxiensis]MBQ0532877.1 ABC transporter permease [Providencia huaxiensis]MBQ0587343.1 ABC transporter permease [Providencia huaxiensis]
MKFKFAWHGFEHAFSRETQMAIRSPVFHWLSWLFPLMLFTLVSANFSEGTLMDLPVSVVDNNHSPVSRQIIRDLDAGPHADVKTIDDNLSTSLKRLGSSKDYALLYIPHNFEEDVLRGRQPELRMYYNALFYASGSYAIQDFSGLVAELNAKYRQEMAKSMGKALPPLAQVTLSYDSLFNPSGSYIYYQQFAATIHMLQLFVVTATIYTMSRGSTLQSVKPFIMALLGKLAPYTLFFSILLAVEIAALVTIFDAKVVGNPLYMIVLGFFYVIAAQSIGLLLFSFTSSAIMAYSLIGMLVSIALAFSGMAVPELSMILPAQIISNIEPLTHTLNAMFDIFLREISFSRIVQVCLFLLIYPFVIGFLIRKRLIKRLENQGGAV